MTGHGEDARPGSISTKSFHVADWVVHPTLNRITDGERTIQVEPRVMHVLTCLASRPGEVFSRDRLLDIVWADTVVCEDALTRTISELRRIFSDDPREPKVIETIRKGGYRLIAPVKIEVARSEEPIPTDEIPSPETFRPPAARSLRRKIAVPVLFLMAVGVGAVLWNLPRSTMLPLSVTLRGSPFTTYPGNERFPALSPDGTQVAFSWDGGTETGDDIYVKQSNTESALRLTDQPGNERHPTWSPDGSTIAYIHDCDESGIYSVPAIGGVPRRLVELERIGSGLDWSPDGRRLAFSTNEESRAPQKVMLLSLETLEVQAASSPPPAYRGDFTPVFSPDGSSIAFVRADDALMHDVYVVPTLGGEAKRLTHGQGQVIGLDWTPDGEHLIFSGAPTGNFGLWRLTLRDQLITWLPTQSDFALRPSIGANGNRLVFEEVTFQTDVYQLQLDEEEVVPQPLIRSTRGDFGANYSPDGTQLAFLSTRTGYREIWVCDAAGQKPRQLTDLHGPWVLQPCWSPDGGRIAFSVMMGGHFRLHTIDLEGGLPQRVADTEYHQIASAWSRDGEWIYFETGTDEGWQIRRAALAGGTIEDVGPPGCTLLGELPDEDAILYAKIGIDGIWRRAPSADGEEELMIECLSKAWRGFALTDEGFFYTRLIEAGGVLSFYDFATGMSDSLYLFPENDGQRLAVDPAGHSVVYAHTDRVERDLILVNNFR